MATGWSSLLTAADYPLGLRREALRTLAELRDGGPRVLEPGPRRQASGRPEERGNNAAAHRSRPPDSRSGGHDSCRCPRRPAAGLCRSIVELIRRDGDAEKGRRSFSAPGPIRAAIATEFKGAVSGLDRTSRRSASSMAATS